MDILPLSSLTKTEVRAWARALGLPEEIASRTPSAGLWQGQTDEGEMGVTYAAIDRYLLTGRAEAGDKAVIERFHKRSGHKRSPIITYFE